MSGNLLRNRWQQLTESEVRRLQVAQLRQYLRNVVLPFSSHYRKVFEELALTSDSIRSLEDLRLIPFTSKSDLLSTPENPSRFKDFILIPDEKVLTHRPSTILRAFTHGREQVRRGFESEFRPIFMTFTTGRSAEPTPFLFTQHDISNLGTAARRVVEICAARREDRLLNTLPF